MLIWLAIAASLFAITLSRQGSLHALLLPRLQIEGVTLDVLDNVFLQDLSLKAFERALQTFAVI